MPLYEYQCEAGSHRFEVIQKFSDAPLEVCPQCGGVVRKLLSSPAIQFKGSGWYITDYARAGKSESAGTSSPKTEPGGTSAEGGSTAKAEGKSETKAESKPETKASAPATSD